MSDRRQSRFLDAGTKVFAGALACISGACFVSDIASAELNHQVQVSLTSAAFPTCEEFSDGPSLSTSGCSIPASPGFANVTGHAAAQGSYGSLGASANLSGANSDGRDYVAFGAASYIDTMVLFAGPLNGTGEAVEFEFFVSASIDASQQLPPNTPRVEPENSVLIELNATTFGHSQLNHQVRFPEVINHLGPVLPGGNPQEPLSATFTIIYGEPFELRVALESKVRCRFPCSGAWDGEAHALNTLELETIVSTSGAPISAFSLDGREYANVVPEPGFGGLLSSGAALLAAYRRRRPI